ncbi:Trehalose recp domain containing protein [Asbolus verrucosus]|uniref:Trehalose recp domain containing protein n=1 Tax=Asbolus verrucosus TaxID=1661398 RepID=A0A482WDX1_ASBVE|nr:Trehalose recp domain containing protein [Asbolus verrucosus]
MVDALAQKWPKFARLWCNADRIMNSSYGSLKNLSNRIKITTFVIFVAALGEYILLVIYQILWITEKNHGVFVIKSYFFLAFPEFFAMMPFNWFTAALTTITMLIGHIIWSFNDLFIVSVSSALALRFKQITHRLSLNEKKANSNEYWIEMRADYDRLVHLSKKLDKYISYVVLLSYSANIFFLLMQLSNVIGHLNTNIQVSYYTYSFTFLIARLVAVTLYGAWISDESKEPAICLNSVPSATYNLEVNI